MDENLLLEWINCDRTPTPSRRPRNGHWKEQKEPRGGGLAGEKACGSCGTTGGEKWNQGPRISQVPNRSGRLE